jgi:hypothetical protein
VSVKSRETWRDARLIPVIALGLSIVPGLAQGQMCDLDASSCDGGSPDGGASDTSVPDGGGPPDGGMSMLDGSTTGDASAGDAAVPDGGASEDPGTVAACSCETALNSDGLIHLCTGSFARDTCESFACEEGSARSARCPGDAVRLCCTMEARRLYSQLYEDCTHPNCDSGFQAQCLDFGGVITLGPCAAPELPDDPETETGESASCSLHPVASSRGPAALWLTLLSLVALRMRRKRR